MGFAVCRFGAPHIASAIHLIWDPLAQHREEPLVRRRKELAGILQTLAGLEKELGGGTAAQTVQVLMGEGVRELSE